MIQKTIKPLISALFLANNECIPHDKWLVHMSKTLGWKPAGWNKDLTRALSTGNFDLQSLVTRQEAIAGLWAAIDEKLREEAGTKIRMMQKYFYEMLQLLVEKGNMSITEWEGVSSVGMINSQPFHDVVSIEDGRIFLDVEKLLALGPSYMYSWFYEIVEAVNMR